LRASPALVPRALDEILRVFGPLVANRRVATRDVVIGGRKIAAGERLSLIWISANRDEAAFDDALKVNLERDQGANLLYGAGIHVCPGAPLARLELQVAIDELLRRTSNVEVRPGTTPERVPPPANGFQSLQLRLS
jgi:cytochrome P450